MNIAIPISSSKTQYFVNQAYADYVAKAGLEPVLFTPKNNIANIISICDGMLLTGGIDLDPTFYNENNVASMSVDPTKDDFERQALYGFIAAHKKVFGICRGFQLIAREFMRFHQNNQNVIEMLHYHQHISGHNTARDRELERSVTSHHVEYDPVVLYNRQSHSAENMFVNSMHHQCLFIGPLKKSQALKVNVDANNKLSAVAITNFAKPAKSKGPIVEAIDCLFEGTNIRAVQWHPEELSDVALLTTFFGENAEAVNG